MRSYVRLVLTLLPIVASFACEAQSVATLNLLQKTMGLTPNLESGEHLYIQYCSTCHHRSGWGSGPREVPTLAGQQDVYLLEQLIQFSVLERVKDEMHRVVAKPEVSSPQSLRDISAYIAGRPRNPDPARGDGARLATGEKVYAQSCSICHGKDGAGDSQDLIPAIGGQQYGYLLVRLHQFSQDHLSKLEPAVIDILGGLSPAELQAVADYTSRLPALRAR
jgi:cytochrome c553